MLSNAESIFFKLKLVFTSLHILKCLFVCLVVDKMNEWYLWTKPSSLNTQVNTKEFPPQEGVLTYSYHVQRCSEFKINVEDTAIEKWTTLGFIVRAFWYATCVSDSCCEPKNVSVTESRLNLFVQPSNAKFCTHTLHFYSLLYKHFRFWRFCVYQMTKTNDIPQTNKFLLVWVIHKRF